MKVIDHEVIVVGAGAAGIGAARALTAAGRDCLVLEARNRVGGRTWTESQRIGYPVDHGGQWFHSATTNPLVPLAEQAGLTVVRQNEDWGGSNARLLVSPEEVDSLDEALEEFLIAAYERPLDQDQSLATIEIDPQWRGIVRAVATYLWGTFPESVSLLDQHRDQSTLADWPIREGMGTLVAGLAESLRVRTDTAVTSIDWSGPGVRIGTADGELRAAKVIITVPTNVLASGAIDFRPQLPDEKISALENLPQGANEKVLAPLKPGSLAEYAHEFVYSSITSEHGCHLSIRPFGLDYVMAYLGADTAIAMASASDVDATAYLADTLASVFGNQQRETLLPGFTTRWQTDPWSLGAYSYARPGAGDARDHLAAPLDERLFFAGEATYAAAPSSVHGAFLSGERAAREALGRLVETA